MSLKYHQKAIGENDEWLTPRYILDSLGVFDLDPCSPMHRPFDTAKNHYTIGEDGLIKEWFGRVWVNPPFNRYERPHWMRRMSEYGNGIMLIPAACETRAFKQYVFGKCHGILMLSKRPKFLNVKGEEAKGSAGGTICLIAYGEINLEVLKNSGLGATLVQV